MKKLFRIGLLTVMVVMTFSSATIFTRSMSASPIPAAPAPRKNKNKNTNEHTKEMKRNLKRKTLILKGRHGKHKEKHT